MTTTSMTMKRIGDFVVLVDDSCDIKRRLSIHVNRVMVTLDNEEVWLHLDNIDRRLNPESPDMKPEEFFDKMVEVLSGADAD